MTACTPLIRSHCLRLLAWTGAGAMAAALSGCIVLPAPHARHRDVVVIDLDDDRPPHRHDHRRGRGRGHY